MSSFQGHALPGTFFLAAGLWSLYNLLLRYFLCRRQATLVAVGRSGDSNSSSSRKEKTFLFRSSITFPWQCCPHFPAEETVMLIATILGTIGEFATGYGPSGVFSHVNGQHMTMYLFFGIASTVALLKHRGYPLPPDVDYALFALAFGVEGLLFYYHLHGRPHMDVQVHMFLVYVTALCAVCVLCEMMYRDSVLPALSRAYFVALQGSWFFQVGFILYPPFGPTWDVDDHTQMMLTTMVYSWHCAALVLLVGIMSSVAVLRVRLMSPLQVYRALELSGCRNGKAGHGTGLGLGDDGLVGSGKLDSEQTAYMMLASDEDGL